MKKRSIWSGAALAAVMSFFMAAPVSAKEMTIPDGVFVGDIELGGMTKEEAGQTIQDHVNTFADRKVTLKERLWKLLRENWDLPGAIRRRWRKRRLTGLAEI